MPSHDYMDIDSYFSLLPNINQWSCPTCSFDNTSTSYPTCAMCHQIDSQLIEGSFISNSCELSWKCPSCTWQNNANNVFCESCYQTKPDSVNIYLSKLMNNNNYYSLGI
jgi:hypothetical protein